MRHQESGQPERAVIQLLRRYVAGQKRLVRVLTLVPGICYVAAVNTERRDREPE